MRKKFWLNILKKLTSWMILFFTCMTPRLLAEGVDIKKIFQTKEFCFLLYDLKNQKEVIRKGDEICELKLPPCSSFKIPLALIALNEKILLDENSKLDWDGKIYTKMPNWNKDHTTASWMQDSVLWFSQRLTVQLGKKKLESYLKDFAYGNHDISGGVYTSWLGILEKDGRLNTHSTLKISANEQLSFMKKFYLNQLNVSKEAIDTAKRILLLEQDSKSFSLSGKTGSGWSPDSKKRKSKLGWFVGNLKNKDSEFVFSIVFLDSSKAANEYSYAGLYARNIAKKIFEMTSTNFCLIQSNCI